MHFMLLDGLTLGSCLSLFGQELKSYSYKLQHKCLIIRK